ESGIRNDAIFANLANAQFGGGDFANAIASYRRALRYAPANQGYWEQLSLAESMRTGGTRPSEAESPNTTFLSDALATLRPINDLVLHFVPPLTVRFVAITAWFFAWGLIAWRLLATPSHWKLGTALLMLVAIIGAASFGLRVSQYSVDNTAIVVQSEFTLRSGDGLEFEPVREMQESDGMLVQVIDRRNGWRKVELPNGIIGWTPNSVCEEI
ncbi:MAG: hypothetical protein ACR2NZ_10095, partial [Rubripirellula sp.]